MNLHFNSEHKNTLNLFERERHFEKERREISLIFAESLKKFSPFGRDDGTQEWNSPVMSKCSETSL